MEKRISENVQCTLVLQLYPDFVVLLFIFTSFNTTPLILLVKSILIRNCQHDLTPRIYVLHKITIALKFVLHKSKVGAKLSNALNLHILKISGRSARERAEQLATGGDH